MKAEEFNYNSLMAVIGATVQGEDGIRIPGELMPSGNPVVAKGATMQDLADYSKAEQWFEAVKETYERESDEKNQERSEVPVPTESGGRDDNPGPADAGGDSVVAEPHLQALEAELQARRARWETYLERCQVELDALASDVKNARRELAKLDAALAAMEAVDDSEV